MMVASADRCLHATEKARKGPALTLFDSQLNVREIQKLQIFQCIWILLQTKKSFWKPCICRFEASYLEKEATNKVKGAGCESAKFLDCAWQSASSFNVFTAETTWAVLRRSRVAFSWFSMVQISPPYGVKQLKVRLLSKLVFWRSKSLYYSSIKSLLKSSNLAGGIILNHGLPNQPRNNRDSIKNAPEKEE
jgi:hypothetical protein